MRYTVFLQQRPDGSYRAAVPVMPGVSEVGPTRGTFTTTSATFNNIRMVGADTFIDLTAQSPTPARSAGPRPCAAT